MATQPEFKGRVACLLWWRAMGRVNPDVALWRPFYNQWVTEELYGAKAREESTFEELKEKETEFYAECKRVGVPVRTIPQQTPLRRH
jgi:hypothetical protein